MDHRCVAFDRLINSFLGLLNVAVSHVLVKQCRMRRDGLESSRIW
jgi:hypothetical protein